MSLVGSAVGVTFVITFVGQVVDFQAEFGVFGGFVLYGCMPDCVTAQILFLSVHHNRAGFALDVDTAAHRPFVRRAGQAVQGIEAKDMSGRVLAEIDPATVALCGLGGSGGGITSFVEGVARKNLPVVGDVAGNFGINTAAFHAYRRVDGAVAAYPRTDIARCEVFSQPCVCGLVVFFGLKQGEGGVQFIVVPRAFPADFVAVAHYRRQELVIDVVIIARLFENAGVTCI